MAKRIDPRYIPSLIDANVLDRTGGPEDTIVDEILTLAEKCVISAVLLPHSVKNEIEHPNTPADVKRRALELIYTDPVSLTPHEVELHRNVRELVRGNARSGRHDRDAYHMVEAAKYGGFFITRDIRLLKKRDDVGGLLGRGFAIVTPTEFLKNYRQITRVK